MNKVIAGLLASLIVSGCAQRADKIAAGYSSRSQYDPLSCEQIRLETDNVVSSLNRMSGAQDKKATSDAVLTGVGVVLFWPALLFTSGAAGPDDYATEIAELKGRAEALSDAYNTKHCAV